MRKSNVELIRFIAGIGIMLWHASLLGGTVLHQGYLFVELFLMLTGYFCTAKLESDRNGAYDAMKYSFEYTIKRLRKLFPFAAFGVLMSYVWRFVFAPPQKTEAISLLLKLPFEIFDLNITGLSNVYANAPMWYLSALCIALPIVMFFAIRFQSVFKYYVSWVVPVVIYGHFMVRIGAINTWGNDTIYLSAVIRAVAGISLGSSGYYLMQHFSRKMQDNKRGLYGVIEIITLFTAFIFISIYTEGADTGIVMLLYIGCVLSFSGITITSNFSIPVINYLGRLSSVIFSIHWPVFLFTQSLFLGQSFKYKLTIGIAVTLLLSILLDAIFNKGQNFRQLQQNRERRCQEPRLQEKAAKRINTDQSIQDGDERKADSILKKIVFTIIAIAIACCCSPVIRFYSSFSNYTVSIIAIAVSFLLMALLYKVPGKQFINAHYMYDVDRRRNTGIDLVKVFAVCSVIVLHYLIAIGYYSEVSGTRHFMILSIIRWAVMSSCPLFMMLSGYLLSKKKPELKYYYSLVKVLRNYSVIIILMLILHKDQFSIELLKNYVNMSAMWYVNMYVGLFLIAPFLNAAYNCLNSNQKNLMICILLLLSSFWTVTDNWWTSYWSSLYPIMYYFIGVRIRELQPHIKKSIAILTLFAMLSIVSIFTQYIDYGKPFDWVHNFGGYSSGYNALPLVLIACICFCLLYDIRIKNRTLAYLVELISSQSLEIYLISTMLTGAYVRLFVMNTFGAYMSVDYMMIFIVLSEIVVGTVIGKILNTLLGMIKLPPVFKHVS